MERMKMRFVLLFSGSFYYNGAINMFVYKSSNIAG